MVGGLPVEASVNFQHDDYEQVCSLGKGAFGRVLLARHVHTQDLVAIKLIERGDKVNENVRREVFNHRLLRHKHVIQFREVFVTDTYLCIAMEYAAGGTLHAYVNKRCSACGGLEEAEARHFFHQLVLGLRYCHSQGVVNRDVKLENTLLDAQRDGPPLPNVKICDFGYSKSMQQSDPHSCVGTPHYCAPEVWSATRDRPYDGKCCDAWSCGVMLYTMVVGAYPFLSASEEKNLSKSCRDSLITKRVRSASYEIPEHVQLTNSCCDLIEHILVADPAKRLTLEQICGHEWFCDGRPASYFTIHDNHTLPALQSEEELRKVQDVLDTAACGDVWAAEDLEEYEEEVIEQEIEKEREHSAF